MKIFNIFKDNKDVQHEEKILQASATLYPNKIIVATIDQLKQGGGISSIKISILPVDTDSDKLGLAVRNHLSLTEANVPIPKDYKQHYADFLNKTGFKNGKEHHKGALLLNLYQKADTITISPTENGGFSGKDKGFLFIKDSNIILIDDMNNVILGDKIKYGWTKCVCNCI